MVKRMRIVKQNYLVVLACIIAMLLSLPDLTAISQHTNIEAIFLICLTSTC